MSRRRSPPPPDSLASRNYQLHPISSPDKSGTNYSSKGVVLSDVEEQKHDGLTAIIGTATNKGKIPARSVDIQAELFDHGRFVDQYSTYISGVLAPGASKHFTISCGCKDSPPAEHDSFKVTVIAD